MSTSKIYDLPTRENYRLDHFREAARKAGNPQSGRKCILVGGTNGKGSVAAFLTGLFVSQGFRVGTYSSPHVVEEGERIRVQGLAMSTSELEALKIRYAKETQGLTYFEQLTLLAFLHFRDLNLDLQILEVGMGGRLDATNVAEPDISVLSNIGLDHQEVLGHSLEEIAFEKAGIFRAGKPAFIGLQEFEVARTKLQNEAELMGAKVFELGSETSREDLESLQGLDESQWSNARLALAVFDKAMRTWSRPIWKLPPNWNGWRWPGRFEVVRKAPPFILDGAHNFQAASTLRKFLDRSFPNTKFQVLFGHLKERDAGPVVEALADRVAVWHLPSFYPPREKLAHELAAELGSTLPHSKVLLVDSLKSAVSQLWALNEPVLVFGSFYLVGEVLKLLGSDEFASIQLSASCDDHLL